LLALSRFVMSGITEGIASDDERDTEHVHGSVELGVATSHHPLTLHHQHQLLHHHLRHHSQLRRRHDTSTDNSDADASEIDASDASDVDGEIGRPGAATTAIDLVAGRPTPQTQV